MKTENFTIDEDTMESLLAPFASEILNTSIELNQLYADGGVKIEFRTHYVDASKDLCGIEQLLSHILREYAIDTPETAMFASEISSIVKSIFGDNRYPLDSIRVFLNDRMSNVSRFDVDPELRIPTGKRGPRERTKYYLAN